MNSVSCCMASASSPRMTYIRSAGYTSGSKNTLDGNCASSSKRSHDDSTSRIGLGTRGIAALGGVVEEEEEEELVDAARLLTTCRCDSTKPMRSFRRSMSMASLVCARRMNSWPAGYTEESNAICSRSSWSLTNSCPSKSASEPTKGRCDSTLFWYRILAAMSSMSTPESDGASPNVSTYTPPIARVEMSLLSWCPASSERAPTRLKKLSFEQYSVSWRPCLPQPTDKKTLPPCATTAAFFHCIEVPVVSMRELCWLRDESERASERAYRSRDRAARSTDTTRTCDTASASRTREDRIRSAQL